MCLPSQSTEGETHRKAGGGQGLSSGGVCWKKACKASKGVNVKYHKAFPFARKKIQE